MAKRRGHRTAPPPRAASAASRGLLLRAALIVVLGVVVYLPAASSPFLFDDQTSIVNNAQIRSLTPLSAALSPPRDTPVAGRPLVNLSFGVNYSFGGLNPRGYRLTNLAIHLLVAVVLFLTLRLGLLLPRVPAALRQHSANLAFAAALLWALHPLNSEVVNYVTERSESLMALCYLLTIYCALRAHGDRRQGEGWTWPIAATVACAAGMLCKESMVTAPVAVALIDRVLLFDSWPQAFRARRRLYGGLALSWLVLAAVLLSVPRTSAGFGSGVSAWTYLLNQAPLVARYLGLAVWPRALVIDYGLPQPLALADVLLPGVLIISLIVVTLAALWFRPTIGLLGALFFLTLAPTSSVVPVATEVGAERRMYLPLAALVTLAVIACALVAYRQGKPEGLPHDRMPDRRRMPEADASGQGKPEGVPDVRMPGADRSDSSPARFVLPVALTVVVALMMSGVVLRGREYASQLAMSQSIVDRWPNGRGHFMLGTSLIEAGSEEAGMAELRLSARDYPGAFFAIGTELLVAGRLDEAIEALQRFLRELPNHVNAVPARELLGRAYAGKGDMVAARDELRTVVRQAPTYVRGHDLLGRILASQGDFAGAAIEFEQVVRLAPGDAEARRNLESVRQLASRR